MGRLLIGQRGPRGIPAADLSLLDDLARPIGAAVHAVQLSVDLHRSRERMVLSMEEERRRIGRDLHDSLGPQLAAISMQEAAHDLVPSWTQSGHAPCRLTPGPLSKPCGRHGRSRTRTGHQLSTPWV